MEPVLVATITETERGWVAVVQIGHEAEQIGFRVTVDKEYYEKLTGQKREPEHLVKRTCVFLLRKEGKAAMPRDFDVKDVRGRFPAFEQAMRRLYRVR